MSQTGALAEWTIAPVLKAGMLRHQRFESSRLRSGKVGHVEIWFVMQREPTATQ
jgi:hypothetical protein